ncbi:MAG: Hydroxyethylthiazole kinase [Firmicutes bacterium]|nr:Hydroxyethylthiazole kinase [candidate division NPL-UPA2 bacterium]
MTVSDKSLAQNLAVLLDKIRAERPLVHQITNYVSVNDCANVVLAIGGAPVMADDKDEVEDMAAIASALVLNIGTLNSRTVEAMFLAGRQANRLGKPVILDPVGVGATRLRTETARALLREIKFAVVRGNISEISALAGNAGTTRGVDASGAEGNAARVAARLAEMTGSVVAVTGAVDAIAHAGQLLRVSNGHPMLTRITGTGCMATALTGAFCAVTDDYSLAAAGGLVCLGLAGERAAAGHQGIGSFRAGLLDEVSRLCGRDVAEHGRVHVE